MILYHSTPTTFIPTILSEGLKPSRFSGGRVFLYKNLEDARLHIPGAVIQGFIPRNVKFSVLEVRVPRKVKIHKDVVDPSSPPYYAEGTISPRYIREVEEHSEDYSEFEGINWDRDKPYIP